MIDARWIVPDSLKVIPCPVWVELEWFQRYHQEANKYDYWDSLLDFAKLPLPLPRSPKRSLRSFGVDAGEGLGEMIGGYA